MASMRGKISIFFVLILNLMASELEETDFSPSNSVCVPKNFGKYKCSEIQIGLFCKITCDDGFVENLLCQNDGTFNASKICEENISCEKKTFGNTKEECPRTLAGNDCVYMCSSGYFTIDDSGKTTGEVRCNENRDFESSEVCSKFCDISAIQEDGMISKDPGDKIRENSIFKYECDSMFASENHQEDLYNENLNNGESVCTDGNLDPKPRCHPICEENFFSNTKEKCKRTNIADNCKFECKEGSRAITDMLMTTGQVTCGLNNDFEYIEVCVKVCDLDSLKKTDLMMTNQTGFLGLNEIFLYNCTRSTKARNHKDDPTVDTAHIGVSKCVESGLEPIPSCEKVKSYIWAIILAPVVGLAGLIAIISFIMRKLRGR